MDTHVKSPFLILLENITRLGCSCPSKIRLAQQLFLELCESKLKWDVEYYYNTELDVIYIKAKEHKNSEYELYIPCSTSDHYDLEKIWKIQRVLECPRITLAIMESDSTAVYYEFAEGFKILTQETLRTNNNCDKTSAREKEYWRLRKHINDSIANKPENL